MSLVKVVSAGSLALAASLLLCVGCGGSSSDGSSGGNFSSAVPADQKLGSISDADSAKLCSELKTYIQGSGGKQIVSATCQFGALFAAALSGASSDAELQQACKSSYDDCTAGLASSGTEQCTKPAATCNATVAEFEACLNDSNSYYAMLSSSLPACATVTRAQLENSSSSTTPPKQPASCVAYQQKCPDGIMLPSGGA